jgi:hypothetical protein
MVRYDQIIIIGLKIMRLSYSFIHKASLGFGLLVAALVTASIIALYILFPPVGVFFGTFPTFIPSGLFLSNLGLIFGGLSLGAFIPSAVYFAAKKMATYLFENSDLYITSDTDIDNFALGYTFFLGGSGAFTCFILSILHPATIGFILCATGAGLLGGVIIGGLAGLVAALIAEECFGEKDSSTNSKVTQQEPVQDSTKTSFKTLDIAKQPQPVIQEEIVIAIKGNAVIGTMQSKNETNTPDCSSTLALRT